MKCVYCDRHWNEHTREPYACVFVSPAAKAAAEKLHAAISKELKANPPGAWSHHPAEFLPAEVECDYGARCRFDRFLAEHFEAAMTVGAA